MDTHIYIHTHTQTHACTHVETHGEYSYHTPITRPSNFLRSERNGIAGTISSQFAFLQAASCRYVSDNPAFPRAETILRGCRFTRGKCIFRLRATSSPVRLCSRFAICIRSGSLAASESLTRGRDLTRETFRDDIIMRINHSDKRQRCYQSYCPNTVLILRSQIINQIVIIVIFKLPLIQRVSRCFPTYISLLGHAV